MTWQVKVRQWIGGSTYGLFFVGARKSGRGPWLNQEKDLPEALCKLLGLKPIARWNGSSLVLQPYNSKQTLRDAIKANPQVRLQKDRDPNVVKFLYTFDGTACSRQNA